MTVHVVTGKLGSGKTLVSVSRIQERLAKGCPVATNLDLKLHNMPMVGRYAKKTRVIRVPDKPSLNDLLAIGVGNTSYDESRNGLLVLDECGTWFNSRSWGDKDRQPVIDWFLHARKLGWDIIFLIISKIPVIGWLFKSKADSSEQRIMYVLLTAHIIRTL